MSDAVGLTKPSSKRDSFWAVWALIAAFGTYFCMYGFRKPFTAASFAGTDVWGIDFKTVVMSTQILGYMLSKFIGIKVISETPPQRRAIAILVLIAFAEASLVLFGAIPRPWNAACLFLNGLSLGMVFGFVLGFLEGRRLTEVLTAGLCASFILADGVTKSVGAWLLEQGIAEDWMPSAAGLIFLAPLCIGVVMLAKKSIARPTRHRGADGASSAQPRRTLVAVWTLRGWAVPVGGHVFVADRDPQYTRRFRARVVAGTRRTRGAGHFY